MKCVSLCISLAFLLLAACGVRDMPPPPFDYEKEGGLTVEQMREDLEEAYSSTMILHPTDYLRPKLFQEALPAAKQELEEKLPSLNEMEFTFELMKLFALYQDAHTLLKPTATIEGQMRFAPFHLACLDGVYYIRQAHADQKELVGATVVEYGGIAIEELPDKLAPFLSYENEVSQRRRFLYFSPYMELLQYAGIVDDVDTISFTILDSQGQRVEKQLATCSWDENQTAEWEQVETPSKTLQRCDDYYTYFPLDKDTLFLQYNQCAEDPKRSMEDFQAELTRELEGKGYERLIVDLRQNGGGNSGILDPFIAYLKNHFTSQGKRLFTLIGNPTGSSAVTNAYSLQQAGSLLVGEPTFNSLNFYGNVRSTILPNSKIELWTATSWSQKAYGYEGPLRPDEPIALTLADYQAGRDAAVEYCLAH